MTDEAKMTETQILDEQWDLTTSINLLSVPTTARIDDAMRTDDRSRTALLAYRDRGARKWALKWMSQFGFDTKLIGDSTEVLGIARSINPDVIIIEAGMKDSRGVNVFESLEDAADLAVPVIVLCSSSKEVRAALNAGVFDVVRKPIEWQIVAQRARTAARFAISEVQRRAERVSLKEALNIADRARQALRTSQNVEPITGLPNKKKFLDLVSRGMGAAERDKNALAVFVIGFNRYRLVVEALGQESANLIMGEFGNRLRTCLQDITDTQLQVQGLRTAAAANLDSARFGLMLTCSTDDSGLALVQKCLISEFSRPIQIDGQAVHVSPCIGAAIYPQDANSADILLQRADNAMREAMGSSSNFRICRRVEDNAAVRKLKIENLLYEATARGEFTLAYQPITDVVSGRVLSAEALLRWRQPDGSYIGPDEFVPVAEESGLMIQIGAWVLDEACRQLRIWRDEGQPSLRMSVNVSRCQLMSGGFVETVKGILQKYDLEPASLDLELSERGVLIGLEEAVGQLHKLKKLNVKISIDDFGTGDAAFAYLKELPIDVLKIDRSYINSLSELGKETALTSAMVALGQGLELTVIAEGVETPEQLAILSNLGCDRYQGFYQSPAVSSQEFIEFATKANKQDLAARSADSI